MSSLAVIGLGVALSLVWFKSVNPTVKSISPVLVNLLADDNWQAVAGASVQNKSVKIKPLDRAIVSQDGSGGQPNPPVNVSGYRLDVKGDFRLTIKSEGAPRSGGVLQLYGGVPIIYDEWRYEPPSIQIKQSLDHVEVNVWDGSSDSPTEHYSYLTSLSSDSNLVIDHLANQIVLSVNNKPVGVFSDHGTFKSGKIWFGADAAVNSSGWIIKSLTAEALNKGRVSLVKPPSDSQGIDSLGLAGLSTASKRQLPIGAAISLYPLMTNPTYRALAVGQFNIWTAENELKPQFVHPAPAIYSFNDADKLVKTALDNDIRVHGHALVFGEANPDWMQTTSLGGRKQVMDDHINQVMGHYKGKIAEWDVINEPLSDEDADYTNGSNGLRHHIWFQAMGATYIGEALKTAHAADPAAKLYINDYGLEADGERWEAMIKLLTGLQQRHIPIDGVGFESHVYDPSDHEDPSVLIKHIKQLVGIGLLARISEIDVHGEDTQVQAKEYQGILSACLVSPNCTSFTTWGISDAFGSTTELHAYPLQLGDDLLWDSQFRPKPAYLTVQNLLKNSSR